MKKGKKFHSRNKVVATVLRSFTRGPTYLYLKPPAFLGEPLLIASVWVESTTVSGIKSCAPSDCSDTAAPTATVIATGLVVARTSGSIWRGTTELGSGSSYYTIISWYKCIERNDVITSSRVL